MLKTNDPIGAQSSFKKFEFDASEPISMLNKLSVILHSEQGIEEQKEEEEQDEDVSVKSVELPCVENVQHDPEEPQPISEQSSEHHAESDNEVEIDQ